MDLNEKKNQQTLRKIGRDYVATLRTKRKIQGRKMNRTSEKGEKT